MKLINKIQENNKARKAAYKAKNAAFEKSNDLYRFEITKKGQKEREKIEKTLVTHVGDYYLDKDEKNLLQLFDCIENRPLHKKFKTCKELARLVNTSEQFKKLIGEKRQASNEIEKLFTDIRAIHYNMMHSLGRDRSNELYKIGDLNTRLREI